MRVTLFTCFLLLPFSFPSIAQTTSSGSSSDSTSKPVTAVAAPESDKTNYLGDKIKFQYSKFVSKVDMTSEPKRTSAACLPAFSTLRGIGTLKIDGDTQPGFIVTNVVTDETGRCEASKVVKQGDIVTVSQVDIDGTPPDRYGLTFGALLVPYKYHVAGSKSFTGNTSVGGYLGWRQDRSGMIGLALQYVVFLGGASVPVTQTSNGESTTQDMSGVSYGVGIIGTVKGAFQMGVVVGADRVSKNAGYEDNGKTWLAVELGYAFSN